MPEQRNRNKHSESPLYYGNLLQAGRQLVRSGKWSSRVSARLAGDIENLIQDLAVSSSQPKGRRPQWRGERRAVLVRMPVETADWLTAEAQRRDRSVSDHAAELIAHGLDQTRAD